MTRRRVSVDITYDATGGYRAWKQQRNELVAVLETKLFLLRERDVETTFEEWEKVIRTCSQKNGVESRMKMFMMLSLLHYFERDLDQIKALWDPVDDLKSDQRCIIEATTQVMHWIAIENPEGASLFREPLQQAFLWIQDRKFEQYWFSGLLVLKRAKRFPKIDIAHNTLINFQSIFAIVCSEDYAMRMLAVTILDFQFRYIYVHANTDLIFKSCFEYVMSNRTSLCHGPLCFLRTLFDIQSSMFDVNSEFINTLIGLAAHEYQPLAIEAYKFLFDITRVIKRAYDTQQVNRIIAQLLERCPEADDPHPYFEYMGMFIRVLRPMINITPVFDFCKSQILTRQSREKCQYSYRILAILLEVSPEQITDISVFLYVYACDEYIQCIHRLKPNIPHETISKLQEFVTESLRPNNPTETIVWGLKFVENFAEFLCHSEEQLYNMLEPLQELSEESVQLHLVKCLAHGTSPKAIEFLVFLAQFDPHKRIRYEALHAISPSKVLALLPTITQTLSDSSFKVRRAALEIFAEVVNYNPHDYFVEISVCVEHVMSSIQSLSNARIRAKIASLLPVIVTHYSDLLSAFIPNIIAICLEQLKSDRMDYAPATNPKKVRPSFLDGEVFDISKVRHMDHYKDPNSFLFNLEERAVTQPRRYMIFQIGNEKYVDARDGYLLQTFACLGRKIVPYLDHVLNVFYGIFKYRNSRTLLATAANSLAKISAALSPGLNLRLYYQEFIPVLTGLLYPTQDKTVAVAIIRLLGTACDCLEQSHADQVKETSTADLSVDIKNPSYFTDFALSHLSPFLSTPSVHLYETVTRIFSCSPENAAKFMDKVIPIFLKGIETSKGSARAKLFSQLEVIAVKCPTETLQFMPSIINMLIKHHTEAAAMRLAASLSFHFMGSFIPYASSLYLPSLTRFDTEDTKYFECAMNFCVFSIIFQSQPFCQFIDVFETKKIEQNQVPTVAKAMSCLLQSTDLNNYQSRISHLAYALLKQQSDSTEVLQFVYNLGLCTSMPFMVIKKWFKELGIGCPHLEELRELMEVNPRDYTLASFVVPEPPTFDPPAVEIENGDTSTKTLMDFEVPTELYMRQWLEELCHYVIFHSPSPVVRSCINLANSNTTFRKQIFPLAFLSCYKEASEEEREHFSNLVTQIIHTHSRVDQTILQLAEIVDRAFIPLKVNGVDLHNVCECRPFSLYLLQKELRKDPSNHAVLEKLLALNTVMGRNASAQGLLVQTQDTLDKKTLGKWHELLRDWVKALEFYDENDESTLVSRIRCHAHVEHWSVIRELEPEFEKMSQEDKVATARYFAWAFYHSKDYQKVASTVAQFPIQLSQNEALFNSFFYIVTGQYREAQESISRGFSLLSREKAVYSSGDINRANMNLSFAQLFVELQETLDMARKSELDGSGLTGIWNKRLKGFKRASDTWIKLIECRGIALSPDEHLNVYLKMISVLRNERKWDLLGIFFDKFFAKIFSPDVELSRSKIRYALGGQVDAVTGLRNIIALTKATTPEETYEAVLRFSDVCALGLLSTLYKQKSFTGEMKEEIRKQAKLAKGVDVLNSLLSQSVQELQRILKYLCDNHHDSMVLAISEMVKKFSIDKHFASKLHRTLATILFAAAPTDMASITEIADLYMTALDGNDHDFRIWNGWAHANAALAELSEDYKQKDTYSLNAVDGFLKAAQSRSANTLEYLCQMFAIFFKIRNSSLIPEKLTEDLLALPAEILTQIIPQLTAQIAHPDDKFRDIVHQLLKRYGTDHFQRLFFQLNIYKMGENNEKAGYAHQILENLATEHLKEKNDAELFVDGMMKAALTCFEQWVVALDNASHAYHEKNYAKMRQILLTQFQKFDHPESDLDGLFIKLHGQSIRYCRTYLEKNVPQSIQAMWDLFKRLFSLLTDRIKKLDLILLPKVSPKLAVKRNFAICIPGLEGDGALIDHVEPALQVLGTQQHPRCLIIQSKDGQRVKFLLKGNEDLRLDKRVMQFFSLINSLLNHSPVTREIGTEIVEYAIVPLSPNAGLIRWLTGADTLHQIICEQRQQQDVSQAMEFDELSEFNGGLFHDLNIVQRLEAFYYVASKCQASEIRDFFWARAPNAVTWLNRSRNFCITTALMSIIGYIIGLGDRHPSNIMIQRGTGRVIHIDFGDSFEVAMNRESYPEKVPFRLTRMIVNALDGGTVHGLFKRMCEDVMWVLRDNRSSLVALLEIFTHEPLEETSDNEHTQSPTQILERVSLKLRGQEREDIRYMGVETQVDLLIKEAMDPANYIRHYAGWCPFW